MGTTQRPPAGAQGEGRGYSMSDDATTPGADPAASSATGRGAVPRARGTGRGGGGRGLDRRRFLKMATGATAIVVLAPAFLVACSDDEDDAGGGDATGGTGAALDGDAAVAFVEGGTLTFALATEPTLGGLDPNVSPAAVAHRVMQAIYDPLVVQLPDFSYAPALAESWEMAEDGLTWTFVLRPGVTFHDGTPFNAEAVKFNFDRIQDPETGSFFAITLLGPVTETEVVDEYTVRLHLATPHAALLDSLSSAFLGIVSPAAVAASGAEFANQPVGTGPFIFERWDKQDRIVLRANPDYAWGSPAFEHQDAPYVEELVFRIIPEAGTRLGALQAGEVDLAESILPADIAGLAGGDDTFADFAITPGSPYVLILNHAKPPFDELAVRQALAAAFDRAGVVQALYGGLYPLAEGPLASSTFAYDPTVEGTITYDPDRARALLDEAGWTVGDGGVRERDGQRLVIQLLASDVDREQRHAIDEALQVQAAEVGFDIQMQRVPTAQFLELRNANEYHVVGTSFVSSDPDILRSMYWSETPSFNNAQLDDPEFDALVLGGQQALTAAERVDFYAQAQHYLLDHASIIPIYEFPYYVGGRAPVAGLRFDTRAYPVLYDVRFRA